MSETTREITAHSSYDWRAIGDLYDTKVHLCKSTMKLGLHYRDLLWVFFLSWMIAIVTFHVIFLCQTISSGCTERDIYYCYSTTAQARVFGTACSVYPRQRRWLHPDLMVAWKCMFTPSSEYSLRATPIKLHYAAAAAVMGWAKYCMG